MTEEAKGATALADIAAERQRQIKVEGWTLEHDDEHGHGQLCNAGAAYAYGAMASGDAQQARQAPPFWWPWHASFWKPTGGRRDLIRAAALIVAEIERLDRAAISKATDQKGEG